MDYSLGRFGDRRLEKGGHFCTAGLLRWGNAGSRCDRLAGAGPVRSGSPGLCAIRK